MDPPQATERAAGSPLRVAVIDTDSGFLQVLSKRLDGVGWEYRVLASPGAARRDRRDAAQRVVVDLAALGPQGWEYLERLSAELPGLGVIVVCTGQSTVAQRVRGLRLGADDWLNKPCHPEELIARVEAVVRRRKRAERARRRRLGGRRRARDPRRPVPGLRRRRPPSSPAASSS